jgi:hypothetical protein
MALALAQYEDLFSSLLEVILVAQMGKSRLWILGTGCITQTDFGNLAALTC